MNRFLVGLLSIGLGCASAAQLDCVIRHGRVVDGSGNPAYFADVAIKDGRVVQIGKIADSTAKEIDATGMIVAPGFIDVHTHADEVAEQPKAENFLRMGVTTLVVGNCGGSALNVAKFFTEITSNGISPNVCTLIGHNTVRDQAMKDGAVGLSTGLIYLPGTFSKPDEVVELAKVIAPYDGIYASHMRYEDTRIYEALDEVFRVAREAKVRAEVSHIKLSGPKAWGQADKVLAYLDAARTEGLDITEDQYAYTASSTTMRQLIPDDAFDGGKKNFLELINNPEEKDGLVMRMRQKLDARGAQDYSYAVIASYKH